MYLDGVFFFFLFFTLVTGPRRSLSLKLSDTGVYEPQIRARLGTTAHFCKVVVLKYLDGIGASLSPATNVAFSRPGPPEVHGRESSPGTGDVAVSTIETHFPLPESLPVCPRSTSSPPLLPASSPPDCPLPPSSPALPPGPRALPFACGVIGVWRRCEF